MARSPPLDDTLFDAEGQPIRARVRRALAGLAAADPRLGELFEAAGGFTLTLSMLHDPYRALGRAIIAQQISGHAARAIFERVRLGFDAKQFPTPEQLAASSPEQLRTFGLSRNKALALQDLALKRLDGTVPPLRKLRSMTDAEIVDQLTQVHGVGVWTVQMMLIFRLGRGDVMASTDYGVRQGFGRWFLRGRLPTPKQVERRGERWRPYRSLACWYLWRAVELP